MKKTLRLILLLLTVHVTVFAQEELGEGDLYVNSDEYAEANIVSEISYVVNDLFTRLPLEDIKIQAAFEKKIYYIDFSADWCQPCKLMDQTTFRDYEVVKYTQENFYAVQLDMSDFDAIEMQAKYKITSLPTILFFDYTGKLIGRTTGLQTGTLFLSKLKEIKARF